KQHIVVKALAEEVAHDGTDVPLVLGQDHVVVMLARTRETHDDGSFAFERAPGRRRVVEVDAAAFAFFQGLPAKAAENVTILVGHMGESKEIIDPRLAITHPSSRLRAGHHSRGYVHENKLLC